MRDELGSAPVWGMNGGMIELLERACLPSLVLASLLACRGAVPDATEPDSSTEEATATASASASTTEDTTEDTTTNDDEPLFPVDPCRIGPGVSAGVGLGFPRVPDRLRSTGSVRAIVLFADFPDVTAAMTPQQLMAILSPKASEFVGSVSYGAMQLVLEPHLEWLRMSQPSTSYAAAITEFASHRDWLQEAIDLADPVVDFSGAELVVLIAAPNAEAIAYGPTWLGFEGPGGALVADGAQIENGITSGADLLSWGGIWLDHELGHSLGLVDSYSFDAPTGFTRPFSLMDLISSEAPEYLAYERWLLGWLDDARVACLPESTTLLLSPIEQAQGIAAVMVPLSATRSLVVESRRALGWDTALTEVGAVAYTVDTNVASGSGPIRVLNGQQALGPGASLTVEGILVEVVDADAHGDTVAVTLP